MISAVFNCFTIPFKVAYSPAVMDTSEYAIFNNVIDFIFLLDIGVAFRTAYINDYGREIKQPRDIAKAYIMGQFWIDLCATIPIDQIVEAIMRNSNPYYELFGILKLGRVLRLNKIIQFLNVEEDVKATIKLMKMIFFLIIYMHFFACVWWIIVKEDQIWVPPLH